jgi:hypothetical protein
LGDGHHFSLNGKVSIFIRVERKSWNLGSIWTLDVQKLQKLPKLVLTALGVFQIFLNISPILVHFLLNNIFS